MDANAAYRKLADFTFGNHMRIDDSWRELAATALEAGDDFRDLMYFVEEYSADGEVVGPVPFGDLPRRGVLRVIAFSPRYIYIESVNPYIPRFCAVPRHPEDLSLPLPRPGYLAQNAWMGGEYAADTPRKRKDFIRAVNTIGDDLDDIALYYHAENLQPSDTLIGPIRSMDLPRHGPWHWIAYSSRFVYVEEAARYDIGFCAIPRDPDHVAAPIPAPGHAGSTTEPE